MRFSEVQYHDICCCPDSGRVSATVILVTESAMIQCAAATLQVGTEAEIRAALLSDALRQMRRMPEFRRADGAAIAPAAAPATPLSGAA